MTTTVETRARSNGPVAAALLAAGVGAFVLGLNTTLAAAFPPAEGASAFWDFSRNYGIGEGVGPLSGKVIMAVLAYLISLIGFAVAWRGREVPLAPILWIAGILLLLGLAGTFPLVFEAVAAD